MSPNSAAIQGLCSGVVQCQQAAQDFLVRHLGRVIVPAVSLGDGGIQRLVGVVQPCGAGIVEVGQGAFLSSAPCPGLATGRAG